MRRLLATAILALSLGCASAPSQRQPEVVVFVTVYNDRMDWATVYDSRGQRLGNVTAYSTARFRLTRLGLTPESQAAFTVRYQAGRTYRSDVAQVWPGAHVEVRLAATNPEPWVIVRR